ncbi:nicotinate-nucleotide adenylyltransferase [Methylophilus sp. OH31]|uniref:nicotinate-nucleotide adenylyltransferase n=1 Tax=Methylophilus sp. OH31 TaxID=1387312 RepID=UPI000464559D|nr:nicotinate-nucleotide adenylyltransferase [Methylophilus sp. OH31]
MEIIGIFGGTFNPIHNGHLALAQTVLDTLHCTQIRFIPAAVPPHKATPAVTAQHRAAMVQLAIQDRPQFVLDTCELDRQGTSYTIETLHLLRLHFPDQALCLIMGQDSYQKLPTWRRWLELLDYCHILVVHRADREKTLFLHPEHEGKLIDIAAAPEAFTAKANGLISFLPITPPDISSTRIREKLIRDDETVITEIPQQVFNYIQQNRLYQNLA